MFRDKKAIQPGKSYTLTRNPNWSRATDPIRSGLLDRITLTITTNPDDLDSRLLANSIDLDASQAGVQAAGRTKLLTDPTLKSHSDDVVVGATRMASIVTAVAPFDNIDCRKAVIYAADPSTIQAARGGEFAGGDIAGSLLPPDIPGSDPNYDPYHLRQGRAQVDKAKQELRACGKPNGFATTIAVRNNTPAEMNSAEALQAALNVVGINAEIDQYGAAQDASLAGSPSIVKQRGWGLILTGWDADYPTGSGFLVPLADGRYVQQDGNLNRAEINDPQINQLFDDAAAADPAKAADDYSQINHNIMEGAYYLPFVYNKVLVYHNPRLTNLHVEQAYGEIDLQALGVHDGT
jgi:peptide/nickel transport system substrate-binding protein